MYQSSQICIILLQLCDDRSKLFSFSNASSSMVISFTLSEEDQPTKKVNNVKTKFKTGRELKMSAQIGDYDMEYIILDLGSNVNILTCQTWEIMGKPPLEWPLIQLMLSNQEKVLPIGRLSPVQVDIEGLQTFAEFEVINIVYDVEIEPRC